MCVSVMRTHTATASQREPNTSLYVTRARRRADAQLVLAFTDNKTVTTGRRAHLLECSRVYEWAADTHMPMVRIEEAFNVVITLERTGSSLVTHSANKVIAQMRRLERHLLFADVEWLTEITSEHLSAFIASATTRHGEIRDPADDTIKNRRWACRRFIAACAQLGWDVHVAVPTVVSATGRVLDWARPLTDEEMHRCENHAQLFYSGDLVIVAIALAEAGADTGEIAQVRVQDVDLEHGTVTLGTKTHRSARVNALTPWGLEVLDRRIAEVWHDADHPVAVNTATPGSSSTAAISGRLRTGLDRAGLTRDPHVRPGSIRAWSGARVFAETGRIENVARWLGYTRLDNASRVIGYHWQDD